MNSWISWASLPLTDPIPIFLLVLLIILCAPLLNRVRIPHIIGLILSGMILGPFGLNVLANDASFELFGKVGILYIMFLAGLEIDLNTFKRNSGKGALFGFLTFLIPMLVGVLASMSILHFDLLTSTLLSTIFASHTLIAYPAVSKMGVSKCRVVSVSVAGTIVTVTASLFLLAICVAMHNETTDMQHWLRLVLGTLIFAFIVFAILPRLAQWFLRKVSDSVAQYIFVLAIVFVASLLAEAAGLEGILGAFFAGLILNRFIPNVSPLMNRIEFVGNAIFIPFFLISIGMMINLSAFVGSWSGVNVAVVMTSVVLLSKWLAAFFTQKIFRMRKSERQIMFGLSSGHAAVTLAVVMIGFKMGLLNENVLNGSVLMILITCTVSSLVTEKAARVLATEETRMAKVHEQLGMQRILLPISNSEIARQLIDMGNLLKPSDDKNALYALYVDAGQSGEVSAQKLMEDAENMAAATDNKLTKIVKSELNIANSIISSISENEISDVVVGVHQRGKFADTFFGNTISRLLKETNQNICICSVNNPVSSVKRLLIVVPEKAELEPGFAVWFDRVKNVAVNLGVRIMFYCCNETKNELQKLSKPFPNISVKYSELASWEDFLLVTKAVRPSDSVIIISARKGTLSYNPLFEKIPYYLTKYFANNNFTIVFPRQAEITEHTGELYNPLHV